MTIDTARLRLVPYEPQHLLALIEGKEQFAESFGVPAADGLRELYGSGNVSPEWLAQLRAATVADPWTLGFAIVHRDENAVVGVLGFKGPPVQDGIVEIAYGVAPGHQEQGIATEAAAAGFAFACGDDRVRLVRAHTLPTNNASTRVLTKCGFRNLGMVEDPDDGPVWRWEREMTNSATSKDS